ncbi:MAG: hypothetical protein J7647_32225 [Cyanobacteria bacterium SBLK]|nr:hypothetical protein [Cyanobacteria bacterium SBLK]
MAQNLTGVGWCHTWDEATGLLLLIAPTALTLAEEISTELCKGAPLFGVGAQQVYDTMVTDKTVTFTAELEKVNSPEMIALMLGQKPGDPFSMDVPLPERVEVTSTSMANADLSANQVVGASMLASSGQVPMTRVDAATGPGSKYEFAVDAGQLLFHADAVGQIVGTRRMKNATAKYIGGTNPDVPWANLSFYVEYKYTNMEQRFLWIPAADKTSGANFALQAAGDTVSMDFTATIDSIRGMQHTFVDGPVART